VLVQATVADELCEALRRRVAALVAGDPSADGTDVGPLISEASAQRAHTWVADAVAAGAELVTGGDRSGAVLAPTLLADVPLDAQIMRDEVFAPVVALRAVSHLDEAIAVANRTSYGLQAGIFTRDVEVAFEAARRLQVGGVMVNDTSSYHADSMPYGGVKASGLRPGGSALRDPRHDRSAHRRPQPPRRRMSLPLAGSTVGYLQHRPLADALRDLAGHGVAAFELTPMPPHINVAGFGAYPPPRPDDRQERRHVLHLRHRRDRARPGPRPGGRRIQ
jgi:hypothetical protein